MKKKRTFVNWCGLLGIISLLSYTCAVVLSPLAYPDYKWMQQAVSDLSAANAPSLQLWNKLNSMYGIGGIVCCMIVCVWIQGKGTKTVRLGIYQFTIMNWISQIGFTMFPLSESGYAGTFQDIMHMVITAGVVILSVSSLIFLIVGGCKEKKYRGLGICAGIALAMMLMGAMLSGIVPIEYFGVVERFSVFSAAGFNAVLGLYLYNDWI